MMYLMPRLFHVKIWMTQVCSDNDDDDDEDVEHVVVCDSRNSFPSLSNTSSYNSSSELCDVSGNHNHHHNHNIETQKLQQQQEILKYHRDIRTTSFNCYNSTSSEFADVVTSKKDEILKFQQQQQRQKLCYDDNGEDVNNKFMRNTDNIISFASINGGDDNLFVENSNYDGDTSEGYETLDDVSCTFVSSGVNFPRCIYIERGGTEAGMWAW